MMDARWLEAVGRATCAVARRALPSLCALAMLAGVATSATNAYAEEASGAATAQTTTDTTGTAGTDTSDTTGLTGDSTGTAGDSSGTAGDPTGSTGSSADSSDASDATGAGDAAPQGDSASDASGTSDATGASDEPSVVSDDTGDNTGVSTDEDVSAVNDDGTDAQAANSTTWDPATAKAYTEYETSQVSNVMSDVYLTMNGQATTSTKTGAVKKNYRFVIADQTSEEGRNAVIRTTFNCGSLDGMTLPRNSTELRTLARALSQNQSLTDDQSFDFLINNCFAGTLYREDTNNSVVQGYNLTNVELPSGQGYTYDGVWLQYEGQLRMRLAWMGTITDKTTGSAKRYVLAYDEDKTYNQQCTPWTTTRTIINETNYTTSTQTDTEATKCMLTQVPTGAKVVVSFVNTGSIRVGYRALDFENTGTELSTSETPTVVSGDASTHESGSISFQVTKQYAGSVLKLYLHEGYSSGGTCDTSSDAVVYDSSGGNVDKNKVTVMASGALSTSTNAQSFTLDATDGTLGATFPVNDQSVNTRGFLLCAEESITASGGDLGSVTGDGGVKTHTVRVTSRADGLSDSQAGISTMRGAGQQYIAARTARISGSNDTTVTAENMVRNALNVSGFGNSAMERNNDNEITARFQNAATNKSSSLLGGNSYNYTTKTISNYVTDANFESSYAYSVHNGGTMLLMAHNSVRYEQSSTNAPANTGWSQLLSSVVVCSRNSASTSASCDDPSTMQRANVPTYQGKSGGSSPTGKDPDFSSSTMCATSTLSAGALNGIRVMVCELPSYVRGTGADRHRSLMSMHPYFIVLEGVTTDVSVKLVWTAANQRVINMGESTGVTSIEARVAEYDGANGVEWKRDSAEWESIHKWDDKQLRFKWDSWPNEIAASKPKDNDNQEVTGADYRAGYGALFRLKLALGYTNYTITVSNTTGDEIDLKLSGSMPNAAPPGLNATAEAKANHSSFWAFGSTHQNNCYYDSSESATSADRYVYCYVYTVKYKSSTNPYTLNVSATPIVYQAFFDAGEKVTEGKNDGQVDSDSMPVNVSYNLAGMNPSKVSLEVQNVTPTRAGDQNGTKYYFKGWDVYWCNAVADGKCTTVGVEITELESLVSKVGGYLQPGMTIPIGGISIPSSAVGVVLRAAWDTDNTVRTVTSTFGKAYYYMSADMGNGIVSRWQPITNWVGTAPSFATEKVSFIMPVPDDYENSKLATTYKYSTTDSYKPPTTATADVNRDSINTARLTVSLVSDKSCKDLLGVDVSDAQKALYCDTLGNDIANVDTSRKYTPNPTSTSDNKSGTLMVAVYRVEQRVVYSDNISMLHDDSFKPTLCWDLKEHGCRSVGDDSGEATSIATKLTNYPAYTGRYLFDSYYLPQAAASDDSTALTGTEPLQWVVQNNANRTVTFNGWSTQASNGKLVTPDTTVRKVSYNAAADRVDWYGQWTASLPPVSQLPLTGTKPWWMQVIVPAVLVALLGLAAWLRWRKGSQLWSNHA
ncbi:hypothetical protein [Bifidobacterium eulemuris]|uniref:Repeat-containing protein n=1 Tax=Bifidobacterium eulemuris TaxID=1765219 RepID=A0A261GDX7_9BIFI|nr:hypothetical protein [Bifidobacterium eulemuris]OZG69604.1 repeat-containing protein [Bifidobacterium eulemuris]QOL32279.1 hypothetical protein BE0216_07285 [Bifidobacterium eulemuris]